MQCLHVEIYLSLLQSMFTLLACYFDRSEYEHWAIQNVGLIRGMKSLVLDKAC